MDEIGHIKRDYMEADNVNELERRLKVMKYDLVQCKERVPKIKVFLNKRPSRHEIINFTFQIQQLINSGVPILDSLYDLKDGLNQGTMKEAISSIIVAIENGKTLSQALSQHSEIFDTVYVALVRVGEESGNLSEVLKDITKILQWHDELIEHTKKIMLYPVIVSSVVILVVSFLMIFLVPQLLPFIESLGNEIPMHTRVLLTISSLMASYWYAVFGLSILFVIGIKKLSNKNASIRLMIDKFKLNMYFIGPLILKTSLARFSYFFAMMYRSGLNVLDALKLSEKLLNNLALEKSIMEARLKIADGEIISESFKSVGLFPQLVIRMLKLGEHTGSLDDALMNVSYFYNRELKETIEKLEEVITPILTIVMGGIMLWIMSAVLGPIYNSLSNIRL